MHKEGIKPILQDIIEQKLHFRESESDLEPHFFVVKIFVLPQQSLAQYLLTLLL